MSEPVEASSASSEPIEEIGNVSPAPKKKAIVVYEGDERWQPPKNTGFIADEESDEEGDDQDDEASTVSGSEEAETADLLAKFPSDSEDIHLLHSKITSIAALRLPRFAATLKTLCLRQNNITELPPSEFAPLTLLEDLDIYDNQVKDLGNALEGMKNLRILDVSFNLLRAVPPVIATLPALDTVYFVQNKISQIDGLSAVGATLRSLELGGNRLRKIEGLEALVNLEELWLGKNKISKFEGLSTLKKLKILSIQSNRITKIEGLEELTSLEELYLSHNGVQRIEGLENNLKLSTLDVGNNQIPAVENLSHLKALTELWMNDNNIPNLRALESELGKISTLKTIYLEGNPCQREDEGGYRRKIMLALPQVKQIDATFSRAAA